MNKNVFRVGAAVAALVILGLLAPLIWAIASAGAGLVVIGVIGAVGLGALQLLPYLGQKLENKVLSLRKGEARKNPIEQLQNFMRDKAQQVQDFKQAVMQIGAQIKSLESMVAQRKRERPGFDATPQLQTIRAMQSAYDALMLKYTNAAKALEELKLVIQDKEFEWKFSQAGQAAMESLNATSGQELMEQMLADEAFSSVTDNFNKVFAELEFEAQHLSETKELTFSGNNLDSSLTIDVSSINLSSVKV